MSNQKLIQRAYRAILLHFMEHGRGPHYVELADELDLPIDEARRILWETAEAGSKTAGACWISHDTDYIESWAPFSNLPTHHLISVDGKQKWYGQ
jgi:hypothetical protein